MEPVEVAVLRPLPRLRLVPVPMPEESLAVAAAEMADSVAAALEAVAWAALEVLVLDWAEAWDSAVDSVVLASEVASTAAAAAVLDLV